MGRWYGSVNNRIEENRQMVEEIKVGDGVTEYFWSDRNAYEVVEVKDQKHISIREYDHKCVGGAYSNDWELISNVLNPVIELVKRGKYWYSEVIATIEDLKCFEGEMNEDKIMKQLWICNNGFDVDKIREKGIQRKYHKKNISIGVANYYYDYEF